MTRRRTLSKPAPYLLWGVLSGMALLVARFVDPYIFGLSAFIAAALSGAVGVAALFVGVRQFLWALASAIPTALSFALLSTYKWA